MADFKEVKEKMKHYKPAIYDLGVCYFEGNGVKENKKETYKNYNIKYTSFTKTNALVENILKESSGTYKEKRN